MGRLSKYFHRWQHDDCTGAWLLTLMWETIRVWSSHKVGELSHTFHTPRHIN
eukprot:COSAG01_NODE_66291_length_270_cov_1.450292_1_plen_51_part_01